MSRREYTIRFKCAEDGCGEWYYSVAPTRREEAETRSYYAKRPWRCTRHTKPDEVLTPDNPERRTEITVEAKQFGHSWGYSGLVSGPGFKAFADDFPPGTRLIVTARIELPEGATE
ncbi:hypothetical protein [Nocardia wallacei]|uniref:hypothetical protein n=1 Tax=Nocardia wallacei TaxID=480035 RepID=UPI0024539F39|nr:hypothetical protein [Nocardia wallacei]